MFLLATEHNFVGLVIAFYGAPAGALAGAISCHFAARRSPRRAVRLLLTLIVGPLLGVFAGSFGAAAAILVMTSVMERLTGRPANSWSSEYFWLEFLSIILGGLVGGLMVGWGIYRIRTKRTVPRDRDAVRA